MKWVAGSFAVFLLVMVWAFYQESDREFTPVVVVHQQKGPKGLSPSLNWRSLPRWNIPVKRKEDLPKKALADAIMDDDVCAFLMNEDINDFEKLIQAFLTATAKNSESETIRVLSSSDNSQSLGGRFFYALRTGNLTYGPARSPNYKEAIKELRQLESLDPENGAYALFAGPLLLELNYPPETAIKYYQRAFSKPRLDTFQRDVTDALERAGRQSATHFLATQILIAGMPAPSWSATQTHVAHLIDKDDGSFSKLVLKFSERVLKDVQSQAGNLEENSYPIHEYQIMKSLYTRAFKKVYPGTVNVPNYMDLMRDPASVGAVGDMLLTALEPMQKSSDCERMRVDDAFHSWRR